MSIVIRLAFTACLLAGASSLRAQATGPFNGAPWHISTGNLSVNYIQASPIGAHRRPLAFDPPPSHEQLVWDKQHGLVAYEDYIAWGAIERAPGKWDFSQHDRIEKAIHSAGLQYVVYDWVHFPPVWLRDDEKDERTLMRCLEHGKETNYLSIFDPRTIDWYDHFYKAVHDHFGDRIDAIYACILGPYGEGNYPLPQPDWVNMGHCHEGYWCGDEYALRAFSAAMKKKYAGDIGALNRAWGGNYRNFEEVRPPAEISRPLFVPSPATLQTPHQRRQWIDFITWYHQAIIDFADRSIQTVLKYFPREKVRLKPGGNAGGVNPIAWGTYCPGYAKMAGKYGIYLQPADWRGAYFGDKWIATAYHFYQVPLATEPAGGADHAGFIQSLFSDAACGARQIFTYDFPTHAADLQKYAPLVTGHPADTQIAILCPTTLYRLGAGLGPTIRFADQFRDVADYDVLDELLIGDGALTIDKYRALIIYQGDFIDRPILDKLEAFLNAGGILFIAGSDPPEDLDGHPWKPRINPRSGGKIIYCFGSLVKHFQKAAAAAHWIGYDGRMDGVWTARRGPLTFMLNRTNKPVEAGGMTVPPHDIAISTRHQARMPRIGIAPDKKEFVFAGSNKPFIPWGFNYDRNDEKGLLEGYWRTDWPRVESDFAEMRALGGNIVRIHLQFDKFMDAPDKPDQANLDQLDKLVLLAEKTGLYLDITGLGCYRKQDVPRWYDAMNETQRWDAQACFWRAVARRCSGHDAVMFYDLMNEPVVPGSRQPEGQWLIPVSLGGYYYVQYITLDPAGRSREQVADRWMRKLTGAIRKYDKHALISLGLLPNSLPGPGFTSGFTPGGAARALDFLCVHEYPKTGKIDVSIERLKKFNAGKPLLIEETFPLGASLDDMTRFLKRARPLTAGCISFFWGHNPDQLKASTRASDVITGDWIERFEQLNPNRSTDN